MFKYFLDKIGLIYLYNKIKNVFDNIFVHKTGNETIDDIKTFTGSITRKNISFDVTTIPSSNMYYNNYWRDKNDKQVGRILYYQNSSTNGSSRAFTFDINDLTGTGHTMWNCGYGNPSSANGYFAFGSWLTVVRPSAAGCTLGANSTSQRWGQIYSSVTTISTSDERMKTQISEVPDNVLDIWGLVRWKQFKMKDSVESKGDSARLHNGLIAQHIDEIFKSHGLNASDYGLFCYDEWDEDKNQYDNEGNLIYQGREAGNLYSIRYEEALCMEAAYTRRKIKQLEEKNAQLEATIQTLIEEINTLRTKIN